MAAIRYADQYGAADQSRPIAALIFASVALPRRSNSIFMTGAASFASQCRSMVAL
jgi:hypothetical protein